jgi:hypothetical protein
MSLREVRSAPRELAQVESNEAHLEMPHFKKYKAATQDMVRSLKMRDTLPIALSAKSK